MSINKSEYKRCIEAIANALTALGNDNVTINHVGGCRLSSPGGSTFYTKDEFAEMMDKAVEASYERDAEPPMSETLAREAVCELYETNFKSPEGAAVQIIKKAIDTALDRANPKHATAREVINQIRREQRRDPGNSSK